MILFKKRAAIKAFYYLMAVDEAVMDDEILCFDEIGNQLAPDEFSQYRNEIITECELQLQSLIDEEDYYEVVLEGVDKALSAQETDPENGVSLRLLLWNMLVIAFSNKNYSVFERKLIKHIVRVLGMDRSIFLEMEQIIKTHADVSGELERLSQSQRPYAEIRPIVDELERRQTTILNSAQELIEDELYTPVEKVTLPADGLYVGAANALTNVGNSVSQIAGTIGKKTSEMTRSITGFFTGRKSADTAVSPTDPSTETDAQGGVCNTADQASE